MAKNRCRLLLVFLEIFLLFSFLTRVALTVLVRGELNGGLFGLFKIFAAGFFYDLAAASYAGVPLALYLLFVPQNIYAHKYHKYFIYSLFFAAAWLLAFNGAAEYLFFYEFGVRYNFIAVDYLVYTHEVSGNIRESYDLALILPSLAAVSAGALFLWRGALERSLQAVTPFKKRLAPVLMLLAAPALVFFAVDARFSRISANEYANELALNGLYAFGSAFINNELSYDKFYATADVDGAFVKVRRAISVPGDVFTAGPRDIKRPVQAARPFKKLNVIVLIEESLSAEYFRAFGAAKGEDTLANLDALAGRSLFFNRFYAAGTRTVRGLEAITLSIPPLPGTSIIKRPDNGGFFSWGSVMSARGYENKFIYGGHGYFDNMNAFFSKNGFGIVDRVDFSKDEITFANIWGVCDGDLLAKTLKEADKSYSARKPFYYMVMTTSNHRPFTYPEGKIDIPPSAHSRRGALKYSDYAIGGFLSEAVKKPWFKDTVFVITGDHCANSAGRAEIPVGNYHIPLLIYSPANIKPARINTLASQIDIAPTVLGLLGFSYESVFFGRDIMRGRPRHFGSNVNPKELDGPEGRAFLSTYQKLGYLKDGRLAVLGPKKYLKSYSWDEPAQALTVKSDAELENEAVAFYQAANYIYKNRLNRLP
ncbi:MAG: sulfatase-like hydrolase/transferase [Elusimicrobia bacterium]|nr:sulfatase-like hydrolase/transferase [Elusimicrobiota bacterium]